jgi:hypothetical protein
LTIHVHEAEKLSLGQIQAFLNASETIRFEGETQAQIYHWIEQVLGRQEYHQQKRPARGLLRSYVAKMTGLSRAQVTRLIARYRFRKLQSHSHGEQTAQACAIACFHQLSAAKCARSRCG